MWTRGIGVGGVSGGLGVRGIGGGGIVGGMRILLVDGGASRSTICQHGNHRVKVLGSTQPLSRPQKFSPWICSHRFRNSASLGPGERRGGVVPFLRALR